MDPTLLESAIEDRIAKTGKKPKAIVPVALYGMPYRIDEIMAIANKYDIPVVRMLQRLWLEIRWACAGNIRKIWCFVFQRQ